MKSKQPLRTFKKTQNIHGREVSFIYRVADTKNSYIRLNRKNEIIVTISRYNTADKMGGFVSENLEKFLTLIEKKEKNKLYDSEFSFFNCEGKKILVNWKKSTRNFLIHSDESNVNGFATNEKRKKQLILSYLQEKNIKKLNNIYNLYQEKIGIRKIRLEVKPLISKWGYYSVTNKKIVISTYLLMYDASCWEYVVVHELCHALVPNHSKKFWDLVQTHFPEQKKIKNYFNNKK